jgi:hypothetical protein
MDHSGSQRTFSQLPAFDPEQGTVVLAPEAGAEGTWTGCPGVLYEPDRDRFLMTYRQRRPRGNPATERGWRCAIAESRDGVHFDDLWEVHKGELGSPSMERFCLLPDADGGYLLYLSYVDPVDNRWRIDVLDAAEPAGFDVRSTVAALTAESTGTEGVKDPYALRIGSAIQMFVSYAAAETLDAGGRDRAHATADIYTTGLTTHPTGLATSHNGRTFTWQGRTLDVGETWDRYQARLNSVVRVGSAWMGFYDGSASERENYEERCGLVHSDDLTRWTRLTPEAPWVSSPHASGSLRYVDAVEVGEELWLYYEYARADGAHDLRVTKLLP